MRIDKRKMPKKRDKNFVYIPILIKYLEDTDLGYGEAILLIFDKNKITITKDEGVEKIVL